MPGKKIHLLTESLLALACTALCPGCVRHAREETPAYPAEPLMAYENASPRFLLKVFAHAPGNMRFQIENLMQDFTLAGIPQITTPSGRITQARLSGDEGIEFNLLLPGDTYRRCPADVRVPWLLVERGPRAFLRSEGVILVDIAGTADAPYFVRTIAYEPARDTPLAEDES